MSGKTNRYYRAAKQTLGEYFQKSSLNGFRLLHLLRKHKYQRLVWFMLILTNIAFAMYFIISIISTWRSHTIVVEMEAEGMDHADVPFPAIAICSTNKLSRTAVQKYAQELEAISKHNSSYWFDQLRFLWSYYKPYIDIDLNEAKRFQFELDKITPESRYNLNVLLKSLAPSCQAQLIKCRLANVVIPCVELFQFATTPVGHCCVFNHNSNSKTNERGRRKLVSSTMGLSVLLNTSAQDFFIDDTIGYKVHVIATHTFPDMGTGSKQQFSISAGESASVELSAAVQLSTPIVRRYDIAQRQCYFKDEQLEKYGLGYSQATCLTLCRLESIQQHCSCLPYHATTDVFISLERSVPFCTLADFECIRKYLLKWHTFTPGHPYGLEYKYDVLDAIDCSPCLPLCSYYSYTYLKQSDKLYQLQDKTYVRKFLSNFQLNETQKDIAMLDIYFSEIPARLYQKDVLFKWYEILSLLGGILGIWVGCSLISGIEIIYFGLYRFLHNLHITD